ncbi:MAG: GH116 family glycosyl-hydrolase [Lentisphaeria bacterium]|nr:GH116 family glycosyl-hydrolase [Lentisphaeria bacterium]
MKAFTYQGRRTREISFPLGGIGSGCLGLGGAGHLIDWEIFNRPAKGSRNGFSHFAVKAEADGKLLDARVLHGDVPPPYSGGGTAQFAGFGFGVGRDTLSGLPHFRRTRFQAGFPFAEITFRDPSFPGDVTLEAFNPFIPHNDLDSSLPAAFFTITLHNPRDHQVVYSVALTARNPASGKTTNNFRPEAGATLLHFTGDLPPDDVDYGDFAIATDADGAATQEYWYRGRWYDNLGVYWQDFARPGALKPRSYSTPGSGDHGVLAVRTTVPPGGQSAIRFVFSWNVPNCHNYWKKGCACATDSGGGCAPKTWKNYYATRFADATASARYCLAHWQRLEEETRHFRDALFRSTLPRPVLDAVSANISILKTPTCLRLEDGSFYGWEGCHANSGCCEGSCTHVWNYAYALPFLFPGLERSLRELDYRYNQRPDGGMAFRLQLPLDSPRSEFRPCADGQFGGVLKVFREWKICGDTAWLRRLWPAVRQSIDFAWAPTNQDRWDPDQTGVLHGRQHHTLDMELFGPNAWLTGFYLAALKAGAEMAIACDDPEPAELYRRLFERGRQWVRQNLFNGEYFIQQIDLGDQGLLEPYREDPAIRGAYWSDEHGEMKYQIGDGCGIDQVLAQWHADLIGLGDVLDPEQTRLALAAIWRHNYQPSLRDVVNPCRLFCLNDEAGTVMFSWPAGKRKPVIPVPYAEETMHGFEYQAASHLISRGLIDEGVAMVQAVRNRYDGERRNPWNEIECGSNYARSMASYALLNAFSGLQFDLVRKTIGFRPPRIHAGRFRCFWSLGTAWGEIDIRPRQTSLRVLYGSLTLNRLVLDHVQCGAGVKVTLGRRRLPCRVADGAIDFDKEILIPAGTALKIAGGP